MSVLDFLLHLLSFFAPAAFMALVLAAFARLKWGAQAQLLLWWQAALVNFVLGALVLALGVVLGGHDGRMGTYAALALAMGTTQMLLRKV